MFPRKYLRLAPRSAESPFANERIKEYDRRIEKMAKETYPETELLKQVKGVPRADLREGAEVIIERDAKPVAVVRPAEAARGRPISESIALAEAHAKELGYEPTMDPDFAADLEEIIKSRKPRNISAWE